MIRRAIQIQPDDSNTHLALGVVLESQGDREGALKEFQIALSKDPGNSSARQQVVQVEAQIKNIQDNPTQSPNPSPPEPHP